MTNNPQTPQVQQVDVKDVPKYQHYSSARIAMRLVTEKGKRIIFTGFEYFTQDEDIIKYLDDEIRQGLPGITKGKLMSFAEKDPMEKLKREIIAEHEDKKAQEAADAARGIKKDMGNTKKGSEPAINPLGSDQVAN